MTSRTLLWLVTLAVALSCAACSSAPKRRNSQPIPRSTDFDGARVAYVDRGSKDQRALIFVHGWCCDGSVWTKQLRGFDGWRAIAVDLPGHGRSEKPMVDYTVDRMADSLLAVMKHAGVARAVFVAHSNGTPVVRQLYRRAPDRFAGWVIVDGALRSFLDDEAQRDQVLAMMRASDAKERIARDFLDPMLVPMKSDEDRARIRALMLDCESHVRVSTFAAATDPRIWTEDPIRVPTLAVMARSPFWTEEYKAYAHHLVPDLEWHEVAGSSHFVMLDAPDDLERATTAFLDRIGWDETR